MVFVPCSGKRPTIPWQKLTKTPGGGWKHAKQAGILTGKVNGITIIDVDDDLEWFKAFQIKHGLGATATVCTGSGGLHLYYEYDARVNTNTDGWGNARYGAEHAIKIDCRNDGGIAIFPGSVYEIHETNREKHSEKLKHEGKLYEWLEGLDMDLILPLPEIYVKWAAFGMNKSTMEPFQPKLSTTRIV